MNIPKVLTLIETKSSNAEEWAAALFDKENEDSDVIAMALTGILSMKGYEDAAWLIINFVGSLRAANRVFSISQSLTDGMTPEQFNLYIQSIKDIAEKIKGTNTAC